MSRALLAIFALVLVACFHAADAEDDGRFKRFGGFGGFGGRGRLGGRGGAGFDQDPEFQQKVAALSPAARNLYEQLHGLRQQMQQLQESASPEVSQELRTLYSSVFQKMRERWAAARNGANGIGAGVGGRVGRWGGGGAQDMAGVRQ